MSRTVSYPELIALLSARLTEAGCSDAVAAILARNCATAEFGGSVSHGVFRLPGYISTLRSGWVDGKAAPKVTQNAPSVIAVDAANGFTQPALEAARPRFVETIRETGITLLAIRNSHHFGALWPDVEPFAEEGLIALAMVNSMACSVPFGGRKPLFGTNPIALAMPMADAMPMVFDMATTTMAHGDVQVARREGRMLPESTGVDAEGHPTGDPAKILDGGALVPFGAHKGSAIALMVELMCAGLSGGNFSWEFDWSGHPGAQTPCTGQVIIGIDPSRGGGAPFAERARVLADAMREAGLSHLPGERRHAMRAQRRVEGISLSEDMSRLLGL